MSRILEMQAVLNGAAKRLEEANATARILADQLSMLMHQVDDGVDTASVPVDLVILPNGKKAQVQLLVTIDKQEWIGRRR